MKGLRKRYAGLTDDERLVARFVYLIDWDGATDCWLFRGGRNTGGYRTFKMTDTYKNVLAHRWSYEYFNGPIPFGLTIDHLCRVSRCVNPAHLEVVTMRENILRGNGRAGVNARKVIAKCGHPFTLVEPDGRRRCAPCWEEKRREIRARYKARKRAAA